MSEQEILDLERSEWEGNEAGKDKFLASLELGAEQQAEGQLKDI